MNLNLSGHAEGWINLDLFAKTDIRADIRSLPVRDSCADRVCASHILEHIPMSDVPRVLMDIRRVTAPGGEILLRGPDASGPDPGLAADGWPEQPGYAHHWTCTERLLARMARHAGLDPRPHTGEGWPDAQWFWSEVTLVCREPVHA